MTIPVICDRCRVAGTAGTGDFSHFGDLLAFEPVQVRHRVNGWDADAQRAFIALLATTGSKRRAAMAIGRNAFGIDQLLKRPDADSFRAAYDRAMAIAKQNGAMKLATGVADAAARNAILAPPSRLRGLPSVPDQIRDRRGEGGEADAPQPLTEDQALDLLESIFGKYLLKLQAERKARLEGNVVAADFYLRQASWFEVALDVGCPSGRLAALAKPLGSFSSDASISTSGDLLSGRNSKLSRQGHLLASASMSPSRKPKMLSVGASLESISRSVFIPPAPSSTTTGATSSTSANP
jgi:hypothetical protein